MCVCACMYRYVCKRTMTFSPGARPSTDGRFIGVTNTGLVRSSTHTTIAPACPPPPAPASLDPARSAAAEEPAGAEKSKAGSSMWRTSSTASYLRRFWDPDAERCYPCLHTHTQTHKINTYIHTYISTYTQTHIHTYTHPQIHTHAHMHKCTNTRGNAWRKDRTRTRCGRPSASVGT